MGNKAERTALFNGELTSSLPIIEAIAPHRRRLFRTPSRDGKQVAYTFGAADAQKVENSEEAVNLRYATCLFLDNGFKDGLESIETFHGGAIAIERKGEFIVQGCRFERNLAMSGGGAISARGNSIVLISDSILLRNQA